MSDRANLGKAARKAIEMQPGLEKFFSEAQRRNFERGRAQGEAKGRAEGEAKGRAEGEAVALMKILTRRGLTLTGEQRRRIMRCTDLAMLERWLDHALSAVSVAELLAEPARAPGGDPTKPTNGRRKSR